MAQGEVPFKLYITGSVPRLPPDQSEEAKAKSLSQQEACKSSWKELGAYLAEKKVDLVVGSSAERSADFSIIEGAREYLAKQGDGKIGVTFIGRSYRSKNSPGAEDNLDQFLPSAYFDVKYEPTGGSGNSARLINGLAHADIVLLLCGGTSTATVGAACLYNKKPALALSQFGGASAELWEMFLPYYARGPLNQEELRTVSRVWQEDSADAVFAALTKLWKYNPFDERVTFRQFVLCAIPLPLIVAWLTSFCGEFPEHGIIGFSLIALLASMIGSAARGIGTIYFERQAKFSLSQLITELALGVVVAFLSFLILQITGIIIEGHSIATKKLAEPDDFQRLAIAMTLLCFGGAYFVESSIKKLQVRIAGYGELF
jgi:hypothetical protein